MEDGSLQFNRETIFALAAFFFAGMAQASGAGDPALGAAVFKKCQSCHQVGDRAKNRVGPQLNDIIGRTAGGLARGEILKKHDPSRARWAGLDRRDFGPLS